MRRKCWRGIQQYNPLKAPTGAVGVVYELPEKRRGPTPSLVRRITPSPKGSGFMVIEEIPRSRRYHDKTSLL